jgi:hypothetical protein
MKTIFLFILCFSLQSHAITFKEWQSFKSEEKVEFLGNNNPQVVLELDSKKVTYSDMTDIRFSTLKDSIFQTIPKLLVYESELYTDIHDDDFYATVGGLSKTASLYFSDDNVFMGANVTVVQSGCSHMDEDDEYYEQGGSYSTIEEAEANHCFDNDVSWSGSSSVDEVFTEIYSDDYLEWTGH